MHKKPKVIKLKKAFVVIAMFIIAAWGYMLIVNRNAPNMTVRQKFLKTVYPAFRWFSSFSDKKNQVLLNEEAVAPVSFYSLKAASTDGSVMDFTVLKGKKVLLVNTASGCGFTEQYDQMQKLFKENNDKLVIIAFPANDFKQQENGTDEEIALFCKANFRVSFPLMKKSVVIKNKYQNIVFQWLTDPAKNGWNTQAPIWNFCKYLVNEDGMLTGYFGPAVEPMGNEIARAVK